MSPIETKKIATLGSVVRAVVALTAWAVLHSVLATRRSKRATTRLLGERNRNGLYRLSYNAVAVVSLAGVALYIHRLPDHPLYRIRGRWRVLTATIRLATLGFAAWSAAAFTLGGLTGFSEAVAWLRGECPAEEPEGQGPKLVSDGDAHMDARGPFATVRNPLNTAGALLVLLTPEMTAVRLAVVGVLVTYAVVGSRISERRLLARYGQPYREYLHSGIPFVVPAGLRTK